MPRATEVTKEVLEELGTLTKDKANFMFPDDQTVWDVKWKKTDVNGNTFVKGNCAVMTQLKEKGLVELGEKKWKATANVRLASFGEKLTDQAKWGAFFVANCNIEPQAVKDAIDAGYEKRKKDIEAKKAETIGERTAKTLTLEELQKLIEAKKAEAKK